MLISLLIHQLLSPEVWNVLDLLFEIFVRLDLLFYRRRVRDHIQTHKLPPEPVSEVGIEDGLRNSQ
jgi:hypothetical protein